MTFLFTFISALINNVLSLLSMAEDIIAERGMDWKGALTYKQGMIRATIMAINEGISQYRNAYMAECARTPASWHNTPRMVKHYAQIRDLEEQISTISARMSAVDQESIR